MNDDDIHAGLKLSIEGHLKHLREQRHNYDGPTEKQLVEFQEAS